MELYCKDDISMRLKRGRVDIDEKVHDEIAIVDVGYVKIVDVDGEERRDNDGYSNYNYIDHVGVAVLDERNQEEAIRADGDIKICGVGAFKKTRASM